VSLRPHSAIATVCDQQNVVVRARPVAQPRCIGNARGELPPQTAVARGDSIFAQKECAMSADCIGVTPAWTLAPLTRSHFTKDADVFAERAIDQANAS
jgi:hypothetical protein